MALALFDRVQETTTTTGTGAVTLDGAVPGYQSFAVVGNTNTCYYTIVDGVAWEVGVGTYSTSGPTLARTTVLSNSNGNTSPITLAVGTKIVFLTYPAGKSVNLNESGNVSPLGTVVSGIWNGTTIGVAYGGTGVTTSSGANSVVLRDSNQNVAVNRVNQANTNTTAAGGTTALTAASSYIHTLVGTGGQTYTLPDATTLTTGVAFVFNNLATSTLTVANFAGTTIGTIPSGGAGAVFLTLNSTVGGTWDLHAYLPEGVTFGTNAFNLGTSVISGGTWQGGTIATGYGGTGLTSYTSGGAVYANSSSTLTSGTLPLTAGGTAATTAAGARTSLDVPSTTGSGASGTWGINITGSASGSSGSVANAATFNSGGAGDASGTTFNGSAARTISYNTIGAPSTTGTNASGTWNISINGNAGTASSTTYLAALGSYVWSASTLPTGFNQGIQASFVRSAEGWQSFGSVMTMNTYSGGGGALQMYVPYSPTFGGTGLQVRFGNYDVSIGNSWTSWKTLLASDNYNSYAPTLTGGGASGTWGISISGNSATTSQRAFSGDISTTGQGRFTGWYSGGASTTLATEVGVSGGQGYILCYNRDNGTYGVLNIAGSASNLQISGSTVNVSSGALQQGGNQVLHAGNYNSYAPTLTGGGASGTWAINITGSAGSAPGYLPLSGGTMTGPIGRSTSVAGWFQGTYNNVGDNSMKSNPIYTIGSSYNPADTTLSNMYGIGYAHPNFWSASRGSGWGMYAAAAGSFTGVFGAEGNALNTWILGYGEATGSWRAPIFYDSADTSYYLNPNGSSLLYGIVLSGAMYFRPQAWIQMDGSYGIYWPNNYGAHLYPNGSSTYTQLQIDGSKNSYSGMYVSHSAVNMGMYDGNGNGGVYREANGRWFWYYLVANDCMGIGTSATSSSYSLYLSKGVFAQSRIDATIYYDTDNTGYYLDPNSTSNLNQVNFAGYLRRNSSNSGYLEGNYPSATDGNTSSCIYTIGGAYQPGTTSLGNMYGIGYTVGSGTSNPGLGQTGWGLYVASGGTSRIFLDSDNGVVIANGDIVRTNISQGRIYLTGSLPGYAANTYPTLRTDGSVLYFAAAGVYSGYWSTYDFVSRGNVSATSDETLKTNWRALPDNFVEILSTIKHGIYDRIDTGLTQEGVSAQSLQKLLPNSVLKGVDDKLTVNYGSAALVSAVELAKYVTALEQRIAQLEARL